MRSIKYVKYNRMRKNKFCLKTVIFEEDSILKVEKAALYQAGYKNIETFLEKYELLNTLNSNVAVLKPEVKNGEGRVIFPYIKGVTVADIILEDVKNGIELNIAINKAIEILFDIPESGIIEFEVTDEYKLVFGKIVPNEKQAYKISNIDLLFENVIKTADGYICLDYEWVFRFPIPIKLIKYRALYYFYENYKALLKLGELSEFLLEFGFLSEELEIYEEAELAFQEYVHGKGHEEAYIHKYEKAQLPLMDIALSPEQANKSIEIVRRLPHELEEQEARANALQEVQRLTQNHVSNLESIINSLQEQVKEQEQIISYLKKNERLISKVWRKGKGVLVKRFPRGSRKRKILEYSINLFRHPVKSAKLLLTESGRNLVRGDMLIGDLYAKKGMLIFPKFAAPKVSIVIPVYNQVGYTYACLASILENTNDVSYEIIIADDVSSDATKEIGNYVKNIGVCRNMVNMGFLKNCNNAVRYARGEYVMFLNNDTQVTPNWLSSLVELIEADSSIGMVGSKLIYPDGRLQEAGGILWSDGSGWNYGRLDNPDKSQYNYVKDVDYISGAAILLSNKLWKEIGGFDELFAPAYCEDSDLAFAVRNKGFRVVYQPRSVVIHFEGISNGTDIYGTGMKHHQIENSKKLKEKWASEFAKQSYNNGNPNPFRARERSQDKPIILFIDHYVPTFDKDAGSKTTMQYIQMFINKGYIVKFLGDNLLNEEPYTSILQQLGVEVIYGTEYHTGIWDWIKDNAEYIDFVYMNRPHISSKYVDFIKLNTNCKIIYYGHDLHFLRESREFELTGNVKKRKEAEYWKGMETSIMRKADMSYYPSEIEVAAINKIDRNINVKAIIAYVYEEFLNAGEINENFEDREGLLFVGGFAHTPNVDAVLWFARDVYPLIRKKLEIPFYIVGSKVTDEIKALEGEGIAVKGFVSDEELKELYAKCKLAVVPLRYGAGVKGKVIEAIYNAVPIVTTSIGAEGIPNAGEILNIADEAELFAEEVCRLYENNDKLSEICKISQQYIKEYHSIETVWQIIKDDFKFHKLVKSHEEFELKEEVKKQEEAELQEEVKKHEEVELQEEVKRQEEAGLQEEVKRQEEVGLQEEVKKQ